VDVAVALIVAAGRGERLGSGRPKALVALRGRAMLDYSVQALRAVAAVGEIVVALPADALDAAPAGVIAVAGGSQRSHSVRAALAAAGGGDPVIVHDAARPLATAALFAAALEALERAPEADAVIAAAPVTDTIKQVAADGRSVLRTLPRAQLWAVQTPQVFRRAALERALAAADEELLASATDDAWLIERGGGVVHVLGSDPGNLKVTTPHDLRVAELLLAERDAVAAEVGGG
jgi:2-C-methyl-D-erythritol 4-phosphate cytidylyltransferase